MPGELQSHDKEYVISVIDFTSKLFCPFPLAGEQPYLQPVHLTSGVEAVPHTFPRTFYKLQRWVRFYEFVKERLSTGSDSTPTKEFYDPIRKLNLKLFTMKQSKSLLLIRGILRSNRSKLCRIALLVQTR